MGLPNVKILLQNGALGGLARFADGVAGLIGTGVAVAGIGIGDPKLIFSLEDAIELGITETSNPKAFRQIKEFYVEGGQGAELYIMLVPDTMTISSMVDNTNLNGAKKLLDYAQGRIRLLGVFFAPPVGYVLDTTAGIDADAFAALVNAQVLGNAYAAVQAPVRIVIEGRGFTGVVANLTDLHTMDYNRAGIIVAGSLNDGSASVGMFLGRKARVPVQRKASRVKSGSLVLLEAFVGSSSVKTFSGLGAMHDKGYIVMRTFPGVTGIYFNADHTATKTTDDYSTFARGRVIDKAQVIAYATYVEELDDEVLIQEDGTLDPGVVAFLESKIEYQINEIMKSNREISSVKAFINPAQNVLATNKTKVVLKIIPVGYNSEIEVELGFNNPNV
ncbi:MAG: hypothetical protein H0X62_05920 [Bacteroidetes bacterium]|nr:hypothetical protein [Bacteroidota bacterium]